MSCAWRRSRHLFVCVSVCVKDIGTEISWSVNSLKEKYRIFSPVFHFVTLLRKCRMTTEETSDSITPQKF